MNFKVENHYGLYRQKGPNLVLGTVQPKATVASTPPAMTRALWLHHNLADSDPAVWPTLALGHAVYRERQAMTAAIGFDEAGTMDGLPLGRVVMAAYDHTPLTMQKSGGGGGFMSYIAFVPGRDVGIFIAVNRVDFAMFSGLTAAANQLLASLAPR